MEGSFKTQHHDVFVSIYTMEIAPSACQSNIASLKCNNYIDNNDRPKVRLYGEKNCEKFVERMNSVQWD